MVRSSFAASFAAACCLVLLLAMTSTARAGLPCTGVVVNDETPPGDLTQVGERCYEPGPFYYDGPGRRIHREPEVFRPVRVSVTSFEASTIQALGVYDISELTNPFPPGQGRADFRPE